MRMPKNGRERWVVRLMNQGKHDEAVAYMRANGLVQGFAGAPEFARVGDSAAILAKPAVQDDGYRYPDFELKREELPRGCRYAKIMRELPNQLLKEIVFLDEKALQLARPRHKLWISIREQEQLKKKGHLIFQIIAVEKNPDELQGGYRPHRT